MILLLRRYLNCEWLC